MVGAPFPQGHLRQTEEITQLLTKTDGIFYSLGPGDEVVDVEALQNCAAGFSVRVCML